jgi:hypothetical protein
MYTHIKTFFEKNTPSLKNDTLKHNKKFDKIYIGFVKLKLGNFERSYK